MLPDDRSEVGGAIRHLHAIARCARPAGSAEESAARDWCRKNLEQHGFSVREEPFAYSTAIGRWMVPVAAFLAASTLGVAALAWRDGAVARDWILPLGILVVLLAWAGAWGARHGVLTFPVARSQGVNLVATRGVPTVWLVAHLDTKSQPMPTLVRAALLITLGVALVATLAVAAAWPASLPSPWFIPLLGAVAGLLLSLAGVGADSPGALDNGTGVAAVLGAVGQVPASQSLGVLFSSAEELGLAGARAWVRGRPRGVAINVDTLDDIGVLRCMVHGRQSAGLGARLADLARQQLGEGSIRVSGLIPGLLTDGVAFGDAGWEAVTLSRGTWRTLARIHRPGDTVGGLTGRGADAVSRLLAGFLTTRT
jgi:hypothetical protein